MTKYPDKYLWVGKEFQWYLNVFDEQEDRMPFFQLVPRDHIRVFDSNEQLLKALGNKEQCDLAIFSDDSLEDKQYVALINRCRQLSPNLGCVVVTNGRDLRFEEDYIKVIGDNFTPMPKLNDSLMLLIQMDEWANKDNQGKKGNTFTQLMEELFSLSPKVKKSIDDVLDSFLSTLPLSELERIALKKKLSQEFAIRKIEDMSLDKTGYTGRGVIKIGGVAIKVDLASRLRKEYEFYKNVPGSKFSPFCSSLVENSVYAECENIGFLPMRNLDFDIPGFMKLNARFQREKLFHDHGIDYNLFLIGLFHSSVIKFDNSYKKKLGLAAYEDLGGNPHHLTTDDPGINNRGESYKRFVTSKIHDKDFVHIVNYCNLMLEELYKSGKLVIIDGDWKPDNIYNGHKVDFACIGYGYEINELAFYLSDSSLNIGFAGFQQGINRYIEHRLSHDKDFFGRGLSSAFISDRLAKSTWLRHLVLRHSVMKKRDLMDDEKYEQRLYYKQRIEEIMAQGGFV